MITVETASRLRDAGLRWTPQVGDHFIIADHDMDDEVFVLANMTAEMHTYRDAEVIGFNGTTEWALDSVEQHEALWLPREPQLRALLAGTFRSLRRTADGWRVDIEVNGLPACAEHPDAEEAYGRALLHLIGDLNPGGL